ncbi:hypothetical protein KR200_010915 [Drosophila serrata]|nr:hypothetical protein KR200_010915 [Drosophila serrata]
MDLAELLQQAQRLVNETEIETDLPRVERTLSQVLQATQEMHARVTQTGTNDLQAHILLGSKGVDLPKMIHKLETLSARNFLEPLDPIQETDVKGYLKNERENTILSVIEETNRNIYSSVERQKWRSIYSDWGNMKESLLNALVGPNQQDFPDVQRQMVATELPDEPSPYSRLSLFENLYAKEITSYNESHIQGGHRTNLVATFATLAREKFDDPLVTEMWNVLNYMANVTPMSRNIDPIHCRQTAPEFIKQARIYLECRYKIYMNAVTESNLVVANRGGIPNVYHLVCSYVSVQFQQSHTRVGLLNVDNNGKPLWPHIYYSLRCGDLGAAVQFLKESGTCTELLKLMTLQRLGDNTTEKSATTKLEGQLKLDYNNKLRVCSDPYKKAVYAIVLACDPHDGHAELIRTIDDFLWMQLSILREHEKRDYNIEQLTYSGLQSLILEKYGENYFNAREKAPLYFQVLALTGQFESAIEFLARNQTTITHAVHMAIALNEMCLLGTPKSINEPLLSAEPDDPAPMKRLNLVRLVVLYAKCFERTDTSQALQYYYLLRHFKTEYRGPNAMFTCVCDLLVENCNDEMLTLIFGVEDDQNYNGFTGGIFDEFHTMDYDMYSLAGMVGDELADRSNFESAIKLYYIAGQLDKALRLVCSLLAQVVHQATRPGSMRERLTHIIHRMDMALGERKTDVQAHVMITYRTLSRLMEFFDLVNEGETRLASEILANNRLVPSNSNEVDECVTNLKRMGPEIIKVLPEVIMAAMNIVYSEYVEQRGGSENGNVDETQDENREAVLRHLRGRAKALTNMAASVPYRMPAAINQRLLQLEILML